MHTTNQSQTTNKCVARDAAIQITRLKTLRSADFIVDAITSQGPDLGYLSQELRGEVFLLNALSRLSFITACLSSKNPSERRIGRKLLHATRKQILGKEDVK